MLCEQLDEDDNHLFFNCSYTKQLMDFSANGIHPSNWRSLLGDNFLNNIEIVRKSKANFDLMCFLWWTIWGHRNNKIFKNSNIANTNTPAILAINTYNAWSAEFKINQKSGSGTGHRPLIAWDKPPKDIMKINFDGSSKQNGVSQIDFIFRDNSGCPKYIHSARINHTTALQAEASALLACVRATAHVGIKKIIVEGDNLTIINDVNGLWRLPWSIKDTIEDIRDVLKTFEYYKLDHCFREGNRAADFLASKFNESITSICNPMLREFHTIIRQDVLGYTFARRIV